MDTQNTSRQLRYLEEVLIPLHHAGFGTLPVEGEQLPVFWNGAPLCRITGKGSVFYRREDADTPQAEDALYRVEDIAAKTLEYMTAMESAPQLKASGLDGDYRILADFDGTVLAGSPSKYGVQFVTWDWDYSNPRRRIASRASWSVYSGISSSRVDAYRSLHFQSPSRKRLRLFQNQKGHQRTHRTLP